MSGLLLRSTPADHVTTLHADIVHRFREMRLQRDLVNGEVVSQRRRDEHALAAFRETCELGRNLNTLRNP
jgi:hypothetical protein